MLSVDSCFKVFIYLYYSRFSHSMAYYDVKIYSMLVIFVGRIVNQVDTTG